MHNIRQKCLIPPLVWNGIILHYYAILWTFAHSSFLQNFITMDLFKIGGGLLVILVWDFVITGEDKRIYKFGAIRINTCTSRGVRGIIVRIFILKSYQHNVNNSKHNVNNF